MAVSVEAPRSLDIDPETRRQVLMGDKVESFVKAFSSAARDEDDPSKAESNISKLLNQLTTTPGLLLDALLKREAHGRERVVGGI